jgi:hypothetical protein
VKKTPIAVIAACVVLLAPVAANAAKTKYQGDVAPGGSISFSLKEQKSTGDQTVVKLAWKDLPVTCKGNVPQTTDGGLSFTVPVKNKGFKARAVLGDAKNPDARAIINGKFKGKNASGTIELSGTKLPTNDGNEGNCQSLKLDWNASS